MATDSVESFADNWDYLRAELRWLDQVLMLAVARQRKDNTSIDRIAQTSADKATSHWWKGIITIEGTVAYDEHRQTQTGAKTNYQQQVEARIQSSHRKGVVLALPTLRDRLGLTVFEKNLVLMSLAPEMNRRYVRLYRFLQGEEGVAGGSFGRVDAHKTDPQRTDLHRSDFNKTDLPALDLALRLLCRNDTEWRTARQRLVSHSPLIHHGLLQLLPSSSETWLGRPVKLAEPLVNFLLADRPTLSDLDALLQPPPDGRQNSRQNNHRQTSRYLAIGDADRELEQETPAVDWADLVLPPATLDILQFLTQRMQGYLKTRDLWGVEAPFAQPAGWITLLTGPVGTGKTIAVQAVATSLQSPLVRVNLTSIDASDYPYLVETLIQQAPPILLIQAADRWLSRSADLSPALVQQLLTQRQTLPSLTFFSIDTLQPTSFKLPTLWKATIDRVLPFTLPDSQQRQQLWQRVWSPQVPLDPAIDWALLADEFPLSGGQIRSIAYEATLYAAASGATQVGILHIIHALAYKGVPLRIEAG